MLKKILIWITVVIVLLFAALVSVPFLFKDKIVQKVKDEANKSLNAKVDFGTFDLSIIRSFPNLRFTLNNLSIIGVNEFEGDTLTYVKTLYLDVDLMSVISGGQINIRKIEINNPLINALVLKDGKANWDIMKPSADTAASEDSSSFSMKLKMLEINKGKVVYDDQSLSFRMDIENLNHTLKGDFTADFFTLETMTTADALSIYYGGVKYISKARTSIKADMDADMPKFKFTFKNNEAQLNELTLGFDGWVAMPKEDIDMDIKFDAKKTDFRNFLSMVPAIYSESFKDLKSSGKLGLNGYAKGSYGDKSMPAFGLSLLIENGMFKYPALPTAVNNVQVNLKIDNADGNTDHTVINLARMHMELGAEPFDAHLIVRTPVSDPDIDAALKGQINLSNVKNMIPLEKGTELSGLIVSDVTAKGRMSSIEKKKYEDFNAAGQLRITDLHYASASMPQGTHIKEMQLTFSPQHVALNAFDAQLGKSDMQMNGTLDNLLGYALKDEVLKGSLNFTSRLFDVNEWTSDEESTPATADTTPLSVVEVPANIDFTLNATLNKVLYDTWVIEQMKGQIIVRDMAVRMEDVGMRMLGGSVTATGTYDSKEIKIPHVDFDFGIKDFDMQKTFTTFETVKKMAPVLENCTGMFSTTLKFAGDLDQHMMPVLNTLNGNGNLKTNQVVVQNSGTLNKIGDALKMDKLKRMELKNLNISYDFKDGRVFVKPFNMNIGSVKSTLQGSNGFDQTLDYVMNMEIPRSELGGAANNAMNSLVAQANSKGANFSLGEKVNVDLLIGGTATNPTVKPSLKGAGSSASLVEDVKAKAKEELDKKKKELEDKAKAEAERLKKEAEDKVKAETERIKKEAEDKAKAETERLKKEAEEKAKKEVGNKLKGILKK